METTLGGPKGGGGEGNGERMPSNRHTVNHDGAFTGGGNMERLVKGEDGVKDCTSND